MIDQPDRRAFRDRFVQRLQSAMKMALRTNSMSALSNRLGIPLSTVSGWGTGRHVPDTRDRVQELEEVLRQWGADLNANELVDLWDGWRQWLASEGSPARDESATNYQNLIIPHELPRDTPEFTGRDQVTADLISFLRPTSIQTPGVAAIVAINGMSGIGKSALAIHIAHRLADQFPDGQLYVNLHGATPGPSPLTSLKALDRLLHSLGLEGQSAGELDVAVNRFRSLTADRRLLIVLDNAEGAEQVAPLLPSSSKSAILITSRRMLVGLEGVRHVQLKSLSPEEALYLLGKFAGTERIRADARAAEEITSQCGYLPLALRIAGARLAKRPAWPLHVLVDRLRSARPLDALQDEHLAVRASLQVGYDELRNSRDNMDHRAADAFLMLGLLDTTDLSLSMASKLLDQTEATTEQILERLVDVQLLDTLILGRYQLHDLLRLYAREEVNARQSQTSKETALTRIFTCYAATARQASYILQPTDLNRAGPDAARTQTLPLRERTDALAWLDSERINLQMLSRQAGDMSRLLSSFTVDLAIGSYWGLRIRSWFRDLEELDRLGIEVARRLDNHDAQAQLLDDLGFVLLRLARFDEAADSLEEALTIRHTLGSRNDQAETLRNLAGVRWRQGRLEAAMRHLAQAQELYEEIGDRRGRAATLTNSGLLYMAANEFERASTLQEEALTIFRQIGDRHGEALTLLNLSETYLKRSQWERAIAISDQALQISRELGDRDTEALALNNLAESHRLAGRLESSVNLLEQALALSREVGNRWSEAEALLRLGLALRDLDEHQRARAYWEESLAIFSALNSPEAAEVRRLLDEQGSGVL